MAITVNTKKRDRLTMATPSSSYFKPGQTAAADDDGEEYERAVAFLRDFHSRRVAVAASTCLHSASLDAILEADRLDEVLSSEFSLALSVGRTRPSVSTNVAVEDEENESFLRVIADVPSPDRSGRSRRTAGGLSRMKKTAASECLLDLDVGSGDGELASPIPRSVSPQKASDYFLDHDEMSPMSKRRRSQLGR